MSLNDIRSPVQKGEKAKILFAACSLIAGILLGIFSKRLDNIALDNSIWFAGFNPLSYMVIWYAIALVSPVLAALCWYAKGKGIIPILLDTGIMTVFFLSCFSLGFLYVDLRRILYLLVFIGAAAIIYRNPKQTAISLSAGFLMAFLLNPIWPFK